MSENKDYEDELKRFRDSKIVQMRGINAGDKDATEKGVWGYIRAAEVLLSSDDSIDMFARLLEDEDNDVRMAAAAYLLPYKTEKALKVLERASRGKDLTALAAQMTLKRWKTGDEFPLPPFS